MCARRRLREAGAQWHAGVSDAITPAPCHNRAMDKASPTPPAGPKPARAARQAAALRRNLVRRKQQARDRADQGEQPDPKAPEDG